MNEYDRTLYPMILKCYHHLHPMTKSIGCIDQITNENYSLDIFQQIAFTSEPTKELVTEELLIFRHYQMDLKNIKSLFQWWGKYEAMFPTIGFLAYQILNIVGSQIETERIFFLSGHTYKLKEMSFTIK
jgi:hypothetical protein